MTIFMAQGNTETVESEAGDVGYVRQGSGHYIENTGDDVCCVVIASNRGDCQEVGPTEWPASNPIRLVATNSGIPEALAGRFPREGRFLAPPPDEAG